MVRRYIAKSFDLVIFDEKESNTPIAVALYCMFVKGDRDDYHYVDDHHVRDGGWIFT